jgi:flagellin-like hook-associated protein FlgL
MASQLSGIKMAIRNSQDGISLVQTAESGMSQISSMVLRMRELAVQMENGIYTDKDRDNAEMEDRALRAEVDKVVSNTRFNDVSLLDGSYDQAIRSGNVNAETIRISIDGMTSLVNEDSYLPQSLSDIANGNGGFVVNGVGAGDRAGIFTSNAGDVNGDGLDDFIIGADNDDPGGRNDSGAAFVVFGRRDGGKVELSDIEAGIGGFVINGVSAGDSAGEGVSGGGDINGDGLADLIVGALHDDPNGDSSGAAFVVFGKTGTTAIDLSNVESGIGGFVINGASAGDQAGVTTAYAGDINGDGLDDLLVGAKFADPGGRNDAGASYVVFGKKDTAAIELSNVESGTGGFVINGKVAGDYAASVGTAGDFNGDGLNDILVGAPEADTSGADSGSAYLIFGKNNTSAVELSKVEEGAGGFALNGVSAGHLLGLHSNGGGDINGDGYSDLVIGARGAAPNGADSGAAYVVYGVGRIGILDKALEEVSTAQSKLGAVQNRLIHNINNLSKSSMLTEQSVGRILDADFATETSGVSKQQILNQAATAMLAQANMSKQSVLVLLE